MIRPLIQALVIACLAPPIAFAAISPKPGTGDPRVQSVVYDTEQVISLTAALGYQLTLELAPDDRIETVAVGNSALWQVTANKAADRVFVKPMQGAAPTNLSVVTGVRTYLFELRPASYLAPDAPYLVRVLRPGPALATSAPETERPSSEAVYVYHGSRRLKPIAMRDDGGSTLLVWAANTPLPAVYVVDADGRPRLANSVVRDGGLALDFVASKLILKRGGDVGRVIRRVKKTSGR